MIGETSTSSILQPPTLILQSDLPTLPQETLAQAHANMAAAEANALERLKVKTAISQDMRNAVTDLERFNGEVGELNHFLKGGDRIMARLEAKVRENLVDQADADALKAALVCRVGRGILNLIQADEDTPWNTIKERLKKAFGGGRWTPEEDIFQLFRETKKQYQTTGQYAGLLLGKFNKITEKMRETLAAGEVEARMAFLSTILKVQLARDTGRKEGLPRERTFMECAQDMIDASARDEENKYETENDGGWSRVAYRRTERNRNQPRPDMGRRREGDFNRRERRPGLERKGWKREERKCHGCGKAGHLVARCPRTKCFECGMEGHMARQCPYMRRRENERGEPMEVNAQRIWRGRVPPSESTDSREGSEAEEQEHESDDERDRSRGRPSVREGRRVRSTE